MTAAPGPQQPDEFDIAAVMLAMDSALYQSFEQLPADEQATVLRLAELISDARAARPAASSAQPDDHTAREFVPRSYAPDGEYSPEESGIVCSDCGWLVGGPNAHPDAEAQHRQHLADLATPPPSLSQQRRHAVQDGQCTHPIWVDAPLRCADCGSPWTAAMQAEAERIVATSAQPVRDTEEGRR